MTCKDCIHEKVCDALIKSGCPYLDEEVPADAFCMEFRNTAEVVPKSEVARLEQDVTRLVQENEDLKDSNEHLAVMLEETKIELEAMRGAANSYKMHYENLARKIFMDIDRVVEKYSMGDIEYPAFLNIIAEFEKKYTEGNDG